MVDVRDCPCAVSQSCLSTLVFEQTRAHLSLKRTIAIVQTLGKGADGEKKVKIHSWELQGLQLKPVWPQQFVILREERKLQNLNPLG